MDTDKGRNLQETLLYRKHRKFLDNEIKNRPKQERQITEKRREARKSVENKVLPNLSTRIQALVDDIVLLGAAGCFSSNSEVDGDRFCSGSSVFEGWEQIREIDPRLEYEDENEFITHQIWKPITNLEGSVKIGFVFGRVIRLLSSNADDPDLKSVAWGFTLALWGQQISSFPKERDNIREFLNYASKQITRKEWIYWEKPDEVEADRFEQQTWSEFNDSISPTYSGDRFIEAREAVKNPNIDEDRHFLEKLNDTFVENLDEYSIKYRELALELQKAVKKIQNTKVGHLEAESVFREAWNIGGGNIKRDAIAGNVDQAPKQVTELMNYFVSDTDYPKWQNVLPLVEEKSSGRMNRKWELTDFGYLVGYTMFIQNGDEHVYRAMSQLLTGANRNLPIHRNIRKAVDNYIEAESKDEFKEVKREVADYLVDNTQSLSDSEERAHRIAEEIIQGVDELDFEPIENEILENIIGDVIVGSEISDEIIEEDRKFSDSIREILREHNAESILTSSD